MHTQAAMHMQSSAGRHEHISAAPSRQAATAKEDHTSSTSHEV